MKNYIIHDPWHIIEDQFRAEHNEFSESIFSIGNGRMGQRANFEEAYSGKTMQGSYLAGVYYPDKTRVGWWKNGYPEYFAKVINAVQWIGLDIQIDGTTLDLAQCEIISFERRLDMKAGVLYRTFRAKMPNGKEVEITAKRMYHLFQSDTASLQYTLRVLNSDADVAVRSYLDGDVVNRDSNYDERFWVPIAEDIQDDLVLVKETRKTTFRVEARLRNVCYVGGTAQSSGIKRKEQFYVGEELHAHLKAGESIRMEKYVAMVSSLNHPLDKLTEAAQNSLEKIASKSYDELIQLQTEAWARIWEESDIQIEGDVAAQQAIRFNIFQLNQTYTGEDARLNIGPKGFTGEKYGGVTYWDTEAYCLPFYLATQEPKVARNLLLYRYQHLEKAIENAGKLGFSDGAALYPMVTINGEECHNEWEITFEEIHRNGAIAFAIYNYVRYTDDSEYLSTHGLEVLIGISRFWAQRVNWSEQKQQYVMLGVTGPNEYENNVNNNWYTNKIAVWCLRYTLKVIAQEQTLHEDRLYELLSRLDFKAEESPLWQHIVDNMYLPEDSGRGVFLQQDGFLDKELIPVAELPAGVRPLNQHWSWDRILRSCYIKQADVLQGIYFFEDEFDTNTIRRNYDFYEPLTVHESSLSPCVHAIIAAKLGKEDKAYEFYLRTARLDLDDYNNDTEDGLHITSMAGTWLAIVEGFAGMRVRDGQLHFQTFIPKNWQSYAFHVQYRGTKLYINVSQDDFEVKNLSDTEISIIFNGEQLLIEPEWKS
ncbi:family 65 glycosyl hydrolase domain-containing protein [Sphingobacterium corticibacterium]|uniref:Glycoside hydrolase family 65 protein n=1 Tax=Sphingobacterium corticibacterium TaxID=2484746 RepID=A0A4V2DCL5_9SPHI|nr:family 65 glycosyl hydrolase domain-containing protein [Sphingobacterium corticibacterium]RZF61908.1 glycoside hydrolase family 65 protein [Sphingobacterium corticibacterium]